MSLILLGNVLSTPEQVFGMVLNVVWFQFLRQLGAVTSARLKRPRVGSSSSPHDPHRKQEWLTITPWGTCGITWKAGAHLIGYPADSITLQYNTQTLCFSNDCHIKKKKNCMIKLVVRGKRHQCWLLVASLDNEKVSWHDYNLIFRNFA